jgi:hypothetical protein
LYLRLSFKIALAWLGCLSIAVALSNDAINAAEGTVMMAAYLGGSKMTSNTLDNPVGLLDQIEKAGELNGCAIEYYVGGGQPPPFYRMEQLRLLTVEGRDTIEFATLAYAQHFDPPDLIVKFQQPATAEQVRRVSQLILKTQVFTQEYPEEQNPGGVDLLSTEIIVSKGDRQATRRYYRGIPQALIPLQQEITTLIGLVKSQGRRTVLHQGKPL